MLVALIAAVSLFAGECAQAVPAFRELTYARAVEAAAAEQKPLFLAFCSPAGSDCQRLATSTWLSPVMQAWLQANCVAIHVDPAVDTATAARFAITATPALVLADATGAEIDRLSGFFEAMELIDELKPRLTIQGALLAARAKLANDAASPFGYWDLGRAYRGAKLDAAALDAYLRAWDVGRDVAEFRALRDGALAGELAHLARNNKRVKRVMQTRRDAQRERLLADLAHADAVAIARELTLWNDCLAEAMATYELQRELAARTPPVRAEIVEALFSDRVAQALHGQRKYAELLEACGDPLVRIDGLTQKVALARKDVEAQQNSAAELAGEPSAPTFDPISSQVEMWLVTGVYYFEALAGAAKSSEAEAAYETLFTLDTTGTNCARLVTAAGRAGDLQFAQRIADRALKALPDANEQTYVRNALANATQPRRRF